MPQKMDRMDRVEIIYAYMLAHLGEDGVAPPRVDNKHFLEVLRALDERGWKFIPPPDHHFSEDQKALVLPVQDLRHLKPLN
jgi:hypothetical protein